MGLTQIWAKKTVFVQTLHNINRVYYERYAKKNRKREGTMALGASEAAPGEENLIPFFIEAVKAYATLGEICGVLRDVFGEYQQAETIGKR